MSRRNYLSPQFLTKISDDGTLNRVTAKLDSQFLVDDPAD